MLFFLSSSLLLPSSCPVCLTYLSPSIYNSNSVGVKAINDIHQTSKYIQSRTISSSSIMYTKFVSPSTVSLFKHKHNFRTSRNYLKRMKNDDNNDDSDLWKDTNKNKDIDSENDQDFRNEMEDFEPNEWEVISNILGLGPISYVGIILAVFFIGCNQLFGLGWLGNILKDQDRGIFQTTSKENTNLSKIKKRNGGRNLILPLDQEPFYIQPNSFFEDL